MRRRPPRSLRSDTLCPYTTLFRTGAASGTMTFNCPVILPLFATRDRASGAGSYTLLLSFMSIGSVAGSLFVARRTEITSRFLAVGALARAASCFVLASAPGVAVAALLTIPIGVSTMLVMSGSNSLVQLTATPAMRGRMLAMQAVVFVGSTPVGEIGRAHV